MGSQDVKGPEYIAQPQPGYTTQSGPFTNQWQSSLFDCFSDGELCLKATFCPCFVFGKTQTRYKDPSMASYERVNSECLTWAGLQYCFGVGWVYQFLRRKEMRERWALEGDTCTDCLTTWCCHCCALIQQEKEVIGRTQQLPITQQGYVAQPGMNTGL